MLYRPKSNAATATAPPSNYGTLLLLAGFPAESFDALSRAEALQGATPEIENNLAIACAARKTETEDAMRQGADSGTGLPWYRVPLFWHYRVPMQVRGLARGLVVRSCGRDCAEAAAPAARTGAALALAGLVVGLLPPACWRAIACWRRRRTCPGDRAGRAERR